MTRACVLTGACAGGRMCWRAHVLWTPVLWMRVLTGACADGSMYAGGRVLWTRVLVDVCADRRVLMDMCADGRVC